MKNCTFTKTSQGFDAEGSIGSDITWCLKECAAKARSSKATVTLRNFNGTDVVVTPTTTAEEACSAWNAEMNRKAEAYRNSAEGKKAAQDSIDQNWKRQTMGEYIVGQAISCMQSGMGPHPNLTPRFADTDHCEVKYDMKALIAKLEGFGYKANAHVAKTEKEKKSGANRAQREVDRLLAQLDGYGDAVPTDDLVAWLAEFSEHDYAAWPVS